MCVCACSETLPYRMVYAIASKGAVLIHDTHQLAPMAVIAGTHKASLTDVAWCVVLLCCVCTPLSFSVRLSVCLCPSVCLSLFLSLPSLCLPLCLSVSHSPASLSVTAPLTPPLLIP